MDPSNQFATAHHDSSSAQPTMPSTQSQVPRNNFQRCNPNMQYSMEQYSQAQPRFYQNSARNPQIPMAGVPHAQPQFSLQHAQQTQWSAAPQLMINTTAAPSMNPSTFVPNASLQVLPTPTSSLLRGNIPAPAMGQQFFSHNAGVQVFPPSSNANTMRPSTPAYNVASPYDSGYGSSPDSSQENPYNAMGRSSPAPMPSGAPASQRALPANPSVLGMSMYSTGNNYFVPMAQHKPIRDKLDEFEITLVLATRQLNRNEHQLCFMRGQPLKLNPDHQFPKPIGLLPPLPRGANEQVVSAAYHRQVVARRDERQAELQQAQVYQQQQAVEGKMLSELKQQTHTVGQPVNARSAVSGTMGSSPPSAPGAQHGPHSNPSMGGGSSIRNPTPRVTARPPPYQSPYGYPLPIATSHASQPSMLMPTQPAPRASRQFSPAPNTVPTTSLSRHPPQILESAQRPRAYGTSSAFPRPAHHQPAAVSAPRAASQGPARPFIDLTSPDPPAAATLPMVAPHNVQTLQTPIASNINTTSNSTAPHPNVPCNLTFSNASVASNPASSANRVIGGLIMPGTPDPNNPYVPSPPPPRVPVIAEPAPAPAASKKRKGAPTKEQQAPGKKVKPTPRPARITTKRSLTTPCSTGVKSTNESARVGTKEKLWMTEAREAEAKHMRDEATAKSAAAYIEYQKKEQARREKGAADKAKAEAWNNMTDAQKEQDRLGKLEEARIKKNAQQIERNKLPEVKAKKSANAKAKKAADKAGAARLGVSVEVYIQMQRKARQEAAAKRKKDAQMNLEGPGADEDAEGEDEHPAVDEDAGGEEDSEMEDVDEEEIGAYEEEVAAHGGNAILHQAEEQDGDWDELEMDADKVLELEDDLLAAFAEDDEDAPELPKRGEVTFDDNDNVIFPDDGEDEAEGEGENERPKPWEQGYESDESEEE